ncbi:glycosyltransferase [Cellulomonas sp.]|uniref:glycosyltransferase family 2 protein n=1 Tax=Cellulomonas sp. TaxID=40001 RepID=UPI0025BAD260|nr:glycosyltransferase [Cellulomonas sp.]
MPFFSVITPVYEPPIDVLREMIDSVLAQTEPDLELVLVDDRSPSDEVRDVLRAAAARDSRVKVVERAENGRIVAASNDAIAAATGDFLALVDHDDLLVPDALEAVRAAIEADPDADYVYTDEDKVDSAGVYYDEFRKPQWSPERLRSHMYTGHLSVMRASLVREVGGFRDGFDGSQDHDLALRVSERARHVVHVPRVLYHWRVVPGSTAGAADAKPYTWDAGRRAVADHLRRVGIDGEAELGAWQGTYRVRRRLDPTTSVSIVIPTRGGRGLVWGKDRVFVVEAVRSVLARTRHPRLEVVVVHDTSTPPEVLAQLRELAGSRLLLVPFDEEFSFSRKCNLGFLHSSGDVVVMLNDDIEVRSDGFLEALVAPLAEEDVAAVGAHLTFEDGTLQHAGHVYYDGHLRHVGLGSPPQDPGPFAAFVVAREVSGLTAACVAVRREVYEEVGGFCETLPVNFNDVDFSLKLRHTGRRVLWLPDVELYHFESRTREPVVREWEYTRLRQRWTVEGDDVYLPGVR